jgi:uncharacterized protein YkwD
LLNTALSKTKESVEVKHTLVGFFIVATILLSSGCNPTTGVVSGIGSSSPGPVPAPVATTVPGLGAEEVTFLNLINAYRIQNGAPALQVSAALTQSSQWMSEDMATRNYFDHTDSLGRDPFTRMIAFGYNYSTDEGENIAAGNDTGAATFTQWKNSPPHNANMLNANYLVIGIGRAYDASSAYGWYWTTDFGGYIDAVLPQAKISN